MKSRLRRRCHRPRLLLRRRTAAAAAAVSAAVLAARSARLHAARLGCARLDGARLGSVRLGSGRRSERPRLERPRLCHLCHDALGRLGLAPSARNSMWPLNRKPRPPRDKALACERSTGYHASQHQARCGLCGDARWARLFQASSSSSAGHAIAGRRAKRVVWRGDQRTQASEATKRDDFAS